MSTDIVETLNLMSFDLDSVPLNIEISSPPVFERSCSPTKWKIAENTLLLSPTKKAVIADIHPSGWIHVLVKENDRPEPRRRSFSIPDELAAALIDEADNVSFKYN